MWEEKVKMSSLKNGVSREKREVQSMVWMCCKEGGAVEGPTEAVWAASMLARPPALALLVRRYIPDRVWEGQSGSAAGYFVPPKFSEHFTEIR